MSKIVRINDITIENLSKYHDVLVKRYGSDCSLIPDRDDIVSLLMSAVTDAVSYNELLLHDSPVHEM